MVVFLWCFCGVFVVFLWWCFCGGVLVVVFLWWCFCGGVLWWCFCGGVLVVVFVRLCFCGCVFVVVFLWWCFCGVLVVVFPWWFFCGVFAPILLCTTKYYSSTTPYYRASERRPSSTTPYNASTTKASKTSISCEASATFQGTSFQNEHFVRGFLQISQTELPKRAFRAMLPTIFTEKASKRIVSCEASSKFHRRSFQNERFARCFLQNSENKLPKRAFRAMLPTIFIEKASKMIVSCEASSKFHRTSFQNERFARCFRQFSRKICVSLQFRVIDTPIPARGFIRQKQNVPRATTPCIPKCDNVRFASAPCAKMYESIDREPTRFAHTKM